MLAKIVFLDFEASRSGATILLLRFLKWFKANADIPFEIVFRRGGDLENEFSALAPMHVLNRTSTEKPSLLKRAAELAGLKSKLYPGLLKKLCDKYKKQDILFYCNTVANGGILSQFSILGCPVITHVHELELSIQCVGMKTFNQVKEHTDHYIAVSDAVRDNLVTNHNIPREKIGRIYGFVADDERKVSVSQQRRKTLLDRMQLPENALVVGACGTVSFYKGIDVFIRMAKTIRKRMSNKPIYFVWVGNVWSGDNEGEGFLRMVRRDISKLELDRFIRITGSVSNPEDYFSVFDVFTLVSRVDSFPLVVLEAAQAGKPIVCFDGAGGAKEFVEDNCGFVVPYLNIDAMSDKVIELLSSEEKRRRYGQDAKEKVFKKYHVSVVAPEILKVIERFL